MVNHYEKTNYDEALLKQADEYAKEALVSFFEKLGLDSKLCMVVNNITPLIDESLDTFGTLAYGFYEADEDKIFIGSNYLNKMVQKIENSAGEDKEKLERKIICNIAVTIVHERIHALRRIRTPKNIIPIYDYGSISRRRRVRELGESFDYVVPCDVVLDNHSFITNSKDLLEILKQQGDLEDAITEALAQIIIYNATPKFSDLSMNKLAKKVMNDDNDFVVAGAKLIDVMDNDGLKRFITTRFADEQYEDLFYEMFGEDFYILLSDIGEIDKAVRNEDFPPKSILEEFDKILLKCKSRNSKKR